MRNLEKLPAEEKIQKEIWRDALLLDGRSGIGMGYVGDIEGVHHFILEYSDGYRGFHYSDAEIEEKARNVIAHIPGEFEISMSIVRR